MNTQYSRADRTWAMFCHLSAFFGIVFPLGHILAPLVVWLIKREDSSFVADQGKQALNFQISMSIYIIIALLCNIILVGLGLRMPSVSMNLIGSMQLISMPVVAAVMIFGFCMVVYATIQANSGVLFRYPLAVRFIK